MNCALYITPIRIRYIFAQKATTFSSSIYLFFCNSFVGTSYCLTEVFDIIERNLNKDQQQKLLRRLGIPLDGGNLVFPQKLENIPWNEIKLQLELMRRNDVVELITKNTLITCLLYTSPSPRDKRQSRMPSSA